MQEVVHTGCSGQSLTPPWEGDWSSGFVIALGVSSNRARRAVLGRVVDARVGELALHFVRTADPLFTPGAAGLPWADPVECLPDLHEGPRAFRS